MIDDKDILTYLSAIEQSKSGGGRIPAGDVHTEPEPGKNISIAPGCDIRGIDRMQFGKGVVIQKDCWLNIAFQNPEVGPMIVIGEGTNIGRRSTVSAANRIVIGRHVLIAPNVFITDTHHAYQKVGIPVMQQGITTHQDRVSIGDESWIGINSVVMGNVKVGRHCVIGANSVVNRDIPDYSVAAGNPARVVKTLDVRTGRWAETSNAGDLADCLVARGDLLDFAVPFSSLKTLQVEVSSACNLNCPQCFRHIEGHKPGLFSPELWERRISPLLPQISDIFLVGIGEPFLCRDFFLFVEDAKRHNVHVHTTSNLQLVDERLAEKIVESGLDELSFSCDGARNATYAGVRIGGTLVALKKSLGLINASKDRHNSSLPRRILNFGAMRRNILELQEIVRLAWENRVDMIIAYHDVVYVEELKEESLFHDQALSDEHFLRAKQLADKLGIAMFLPGLFSRPIKYSPGPIYCTYPFSHLYVYHDGRVGPCCMDFPDRYILGDINDSSVEEIWNSLPLLKLRKSLTGSPSATCRYCVSHGKMDISDPRFFFRFGGSENYLNRLLNKGENQERTDPHA